MWPRIILIAIVFTYDASPIDLIPDFLPAIGGLDDALLSAFAVWLAGRRYPHKMDA